MPHRSALPPIITLTTDFGLHDSYVGVMKGVIMSICPHAQIIDITHSIAPQQIHAAVRVLAQAVPYFPPATIHLVVVDPEVGMATRQPIALETAQGRFVGPDNGLFGPVWQHGRSIGTVRGVHLNQPAFWLPHLSATFHGRDLFAPVAAHLANGVDLAVLGAALSAPHHLDLPTPTCTATAITGTIIAVDHFGNCISNITASMLDQLGARHTLRVTLGATLLHLPIRHTYADVPSGCAVAVISSDDALEVAIRAGHASHIYQIGVGTPVVVQVQP
ncbi:MAG: SAM-dependent chlorinase/fluorinase [Chloroflexaceae bacterium]|nr:SAM-dependent chlorinase/fluorinase [Chloroflexaceae bacterium]